jgi:hypothetical protein
VNPAEPPQPKPKWTAKRAYTFDLETQYALLKSIGAADPVAVLCKVGNDVATAKRFWHEVFQDLPELRVHFPVHAERFGPYEAATQRAEAVRVAEPIFERPWS